MQAHYWNTNADSLEDEWSRVDFEIEFILNPNATSIDVQQSEDIEPNLEDEVLTGFFFDQRFLALYTRNSTGFDYLRAYHYNSTSKNFEQLNIKEGNFGHHLFSLENYPAYSNKYRIIQVGYLLFDQQQHILTISRMDIDLDAANTDSMILSKQTEYLKFNELEFPRVTVREFCFDHLVSKGNIIVLICEDGLNIKIFNQNLEIIEDINLTQFDTLFAQYNFKFHDLTIIQHAPNAYQIYIRLEISNQDQEEDAGKVLYIEVYTEEPFVYMKIFEV